MRHLLKSLLILFVSSGIIFHCYAQKPSARLSGQALVDSLLKELPAAKEDTNKVNLLNKLSINYYSFDPTNGLKYAQDALALAQIMEFKRGEAVAYQQIGINYLALSDYPKALDNQLMALRLDEELHNKLGIARNLGNIGNIYINMENYPKTLEYYQQALKMFDELGDKGDEGVTLGNIANIYSNQLNFPKALEYSLKALKIDEELGWRGGIAANLSNIGAVYDGQRNYSTSLGYYFRALKMFEDLDDKHSVAVNLGNIGECYLNITKDTGRIKPDHFIPASKAAILNKAIDYSKRAMKLCTELDDLDDLEIYSLNLSEAQAIVGDYKDALESYKEAITLNDSIFGAENNVKMLNLETKQEIDLKNKQIEIDKLAVVKKRNERVFFITGMGLTLLVIIFMLRNYYLQRKSNTQLSKEKNRSDDLLLNILPAEVANELKNTGTAAARHFDNVTVMFTDFINFTQAGERMSPQELIYELDTCFKAFDEIVTRHNIEKIKTIGDSYLAVSGLPVSDALHAEHMMNAAIEINSFMQKRLQQLPDKTFAIRIGIHSGSIVAGIVGVKKFAYDIWGDTVNTASRMERHSEAGKINISDATYALLKDKFGCIYRGEIEVKNKGLMKMYFVS